MPTGDFERFFRRAAARVRRTLATRFLLDGLTVGTVLGTVIAAGFWLLGRGGFVTVAATVAVAGTATAVAIAVQRRWSDADVALFLDARLTHDEIISTALEQAGRDHDVAREITQAASRALEQNRSNIARPRLLRRSHAALPLAVAALVGLSLLPARPTRSHETMTPPSPDLVRGPLDGLRRVEQLREVATTTAEERRRFDALAKSARELEDRAKTGLDKRDALDALGKLRDGIDAELSSLADAKNRPGLEAAVRALERYPETSEAARALGNADLPAFDREMARLANRAEAAARETARQALEQATDAARHQGAEDVTRALDEEQHLLKQRAGQSEALRKLAHLLEGSLPEDERRQLQRLEREATDTQEALADALAKAVETLSPEERQKLGDSLRHATEQMQNDGSLSHDDVERLVKSLSTNEAREELAKELKKIAAGKTSRQSRRAQALSMAELGVADAERAVSGSSTESGPLGGKSDPTAPSIGNQSSSRSDPSGSIGTHAGETPAIAASSLPARLRLSAAGGIPEGVAPGTSAPEPGRTAKQGGSAAIQVAGPSEVGAVEHSDIPREYRAQVGRYFAP